MSLRNALLGLLADRPASGYELAETFRGMLGIMWPASHPQIYTELRHLSDEGLVEVVETGPRGRKDYEATSKGREELHHWLSSEVTDRTLRSEALLRSFFASHLSPEERRAWFEAEAEYYRSMADKYGQVGREKVRGDFGRDPWVQSAELTVEAGVRVFSALADWARWAAEQHIVDAQPRISESPDFPEPTHVTALGEPAEDEQRP